MPRALYAPGKKGIQFATRSQSGQNPEHMKAHLLCFECEQRFDRLGESEVLRWLAPKAKKQFPLHDRLRVAMPCAEIPLYSVYKGFDIGLNTEKFAYFALSIFWRRSIHDWTNFDGTLMPPWDLGVFGDLMRQFLSGETEFPPDTSVIVLVCSDTYSREHWTGPATDTVDNCIGFEFLARGVYFRALMGKHLPSHLRNLSCASPYGRIMYGHCRRITEEAPDTRRFSKLTIPNVFRDLNFM